jgi:hypothetical protein
MTTETTETQRSTQEETSPPTEAQRIAQTLPLPVDRRGFGRRLLLGLPLLGAALGAGQATPAQAGGANDPWRLEGNNNADANDLLGTTNNVSLRIGANNLEIMRVTPESRVGVGVNNPVGKVHASTTNNPYALLGECDSASATAAAVEGRLTTAAPGLSPVSQASGVRGVITSATTAQGYGVCGQHNGSGVAVHGTSNQGIGVRGFALAANGGNVIGVYGVSSSTTGRGVSGLAAAASGINYGVRGQSDSNEGTGVAGYAGAGTGATRGVYGESDSVNGHGVSGTATAISGLNHGVRGQTNSTQGRAVAGYAVALSGSTYGVYGHSSSPDGRGVYGSNNNANGDTYGVYGRSESTAGRGVCGLAVANSGDNFGVLGVSHSTAGVGVAGFAYADIGVTYGVYGHTDSSSGWAGYFVGKARVTGNLSVQGTLSKAAGSFKIDHPLDPQNKYLSHSFVESPDMLNMYNGNATLDAKGEATVTLPTYFEALNKEFRYQLTCIGQHAPIYVKQKIQNNRFVIAGGSAGLEVSWQVTGIRKDPYAEANRIPVEEDKPQDERGSYLHPKEHNQPKDKGLAARHALKDGLKQRARREADETVAP